jgi:hypothetical protein
MAFRTQIEEEEDNSQDEDHLEKMNGPLDTNRSFSKIDTIEEKIKGSLFKLAIAYNNGAIEYEFLGQLQEALDFFLNAMTLAEKIFGTEDEKT